MYKKLLLLPKTAALATLLMSAPLVQGRTAAAAVAVSEVMEMKRLSNDLQSLITSFVKEHPQNALVQGNYGSAWLNFTEMPAHNERPDYAQMLIYMYKLITQSQYAPTPEEALSGILVPTKKNIAVVSQILTQAHSFNIAPIQEIPAIKKALSNLTDAHYYPITNFSIKNVTDNQMSLFANQLWALQWNLAYHFPQIASIDEKTMNNSLDFDAPHIQMISAKKLITLVIGYSLVQQYFATVTHTPISITDALLLSLATGTTSPIAPTPTTLKKFHQIVNKVSAKQLPEQIRPSLPAINEALCSLINLSQEELQEEVTSIFNRLEMIRS